jgi:hypothetical protein
VEPVTQREFLALCIGLVLIVLGWTMETGGERAGGALDERPGEVDEGSVSSAALVGEAPSSAGGELGTSHAVRADAATELEGEAQRPSGSAGAGSMPSLEPSAWPAEGLFVRVTNSDGAAAVGAPIGVWVVGGRSPLALLESDVQGRVHFVGVPAVAARYEVGLAAPGVQRAGWPVGDVEGVGLARALPLELVLPPCGTLEVHVVRASRSGTRVELGQGTAAEFQVVQVRAAEGDGVARFQWLPLGLELTLRVPFGEGVAEVVVAGPVRLPAVKGTPVEAGVASRRVSVGPDGLLQG